MEKTKSILIALLLTTSIHFDLSAQKNPASDFAGNYRLSHEILAGPEEERVVINDSLAVVAVNDNEISFSLSSYFNNGHSCGLSGKAIWKNDYFEYNEKVDDGSNDVCLVRIKLSGEKITLQAEGACYYYCGVRGTLNGATFYKTK